MSKESCLVSPATPIVTPSLEPSGSVTKNSEAGWAKRTSSPRALDEVNRVTTNRYGSKQDK